MLTEIIIMLLVVMLIVLILLIYDNYLYNTYKRNIKSWTSEFEKFLPILELIEQKEIYLMNETYEEMLATYMILPSHFRKHKKQFKEWKYKKYIPQVHRLFSQGFLEKYNKSFIDTQLHKDHINELLSNIDNKSLDIQQREVVLSDERNTLVIAGAGSGKTLTISGKVQYLTKELGIDPNEILLVTFTNKASDEMKERILSRLGINVKVYTFHKLGLDIISQFAGYKPSIAKEELLDRIITNYLEKEVFEDQKASEILLDFFSYYFYTPFDEAEFRNLTEYYTEIKSNQLETLRDQIDGFEYITEKLKTDKVTLKKERVKSYEELAIANYLYLNNVQYVYEAYYQKKLADETHMQYRPDFYLPDYDIYIEHYGITEDGRVPWLNKKMEQEYLRGIEWKRNLHNADNNKYIESYSYYNTEGVLLEKLEKNLKEFEVYLAPKDKSEVLSQIVEKDHYFYSEFQKLIGTFINQFKVNGYSSFEELKSKAKLLYRNPTRAFLFLDIIKPIFHRYQQTLQERDEIDFNDMINDATKIVKNSGIKKKYKYIIVDEYQDISYTRFMLINAIRNSCKSKLLVVGDDWQSIYRFAGSDVNLIIEFEDLNEKKTVTKSLEKTYRNSQDLLDVVGHFIIKNDAQRKKQLVSDKTLELPISIQTYTDNKLEVITKAVENIQEKFPDVKEILLLGRYNFDNKTVFDNSEVKIDKYLKSIFKDIRFVYLTVHKAKGLEGEHVILLNNENSKLGFPSKISDDRLLEMVLPRKEPLKFAEERRLFYVALTRTKNTITLITPKYNPSVFIKELVEDGILPDVFNDRLIKCPKCGGSMILRDDIFYGCLNYPLCDHTVSVNAELDKHCKKCNDYLVKRKGPNGDFYGCNSFKYINDPIKLGCKETENMQ